MPTRAPTRRHRRQGNETVPQSREQTAYLSVVESRRLAEADLFRRLSDRPLQGNVNAYEALQGMLDASYHELAFWQSEINDKTQLQLSQSAPLRRILQLVHKLRAEVEFVSGTMIKLGLDERVAAVKENQLKLIVQALDQAMAAAGVTPDQRRLIGQQLKQLQPGQLEEE